MRWRPSAIFWLSGCLLAQSDMPRGIVRGSLVSVEGTAAGGTLQVQKADGAIYGCLYDAHTYFERDRWPITVASLTIGVPVEVLSDRKLGSRNCYARILQVGLPKPQPQMRPASRASGQSELIFAPRGDLTFAGIVIRSDVQSFTIRNGEGERIIALRPDTRYSAGGMRMDAATPLVNKHVFVRCGRDISSGKIEAYQIMWGGILAP